MASSEWKHKGDAHFVWLFGARRVCLGAKLACALLLPGVVNADCTQWAQSLNACSSADYFREINFGPTRVFEVSSGVFIERDTGLTWQMRGGACLTERKLVEVGKELAQLRAENTELKKPTSIWGIVVVGVVLFGAGFGLALALK